MFKNYLHGIDGIATYPLFSLVVFFLFFLAVFIWSVKADKNVLNEVSRIPLDSDDASVTKS